MRKLIFIVMLVLPLSGYGQMAVTAPALELQGLTTNATLASVLAGIELSNDAMEDINNIRKAAGFVGDLKAIADLIVVMESYACLAKDLSADLAYVDGIIGPESSCLFDFNMNVAFTQLQFSQDLLNKILENGFSMEPGDRVEAIGGVIDHYSTTMKEMSKQKTRIRMLIRKYEREVDFSDSEDWLWSMTFDKSSSSSFF